MFKSINSKLILAIGVFSGVITVVFFFVFLKHQNKQLISEVFRGASIFSDTVFRSTRYDMLVGNRQGVHRMIETIGQQEGIDFVRIFNKEGKIMFSTNKAEIQNYVDKNAEACYICHAAEKPLERLTTTERSRIFQGRAHRVLAMITPIYNEPDCYRSSCHAHSPDQQVLGVLDIGMSLVEVDNELRRNSLTIIIFSVIMILCVASILTFLVHRMVIKPVKQLVQATRKVANGDLDVSITPRTRDEIGHLAKSFDRMIQDLKKAHQEISSWNIELEKKVEERTWKLQMAKEQLLQSEKMASLGVLASSVAHEINNPLQGILNYIKLMLKIISKNKANSDRLQDFKSYLHLMGDEIERLGDMVKNLLVFSRQSKPEIRKADVNAIIRNSLVLLENKVRLQNIEVNLDLQEEISSIYCDFNQIQQTMLALIINAIEAMPEGGKIFTATRCLEDGGVEVTIRDTGAGIPREHLKNIFDPFFTTKESAKSTGLGLFVAYGIIQDHNGTIEVDSEVGEGTTFRITLPVGVME